MRLRRSSWLRQVLATAAAIPIVRARSAEAETSLVRIGNSPVEANGSPFYAEDMGFFQRAGLTTHVDILHNGAAVAAAVAGGSLDIGPSSPFVFMNAWRHRLPVTLIAPGGLYESSEATTLLVVPPASPIQSAKDLNGKVIGGLTIGAMDQLSIWSWVDQNGGDSSTVKVVEISPNEMVDAMEQGRIAAALLPDPQLSAAGSRVRSLGKPYDAIAKTFLASVWYTTRDWASQNPLSVRKFVQAMAEAATWAGANPEKAAVSLEKWTRVKEARIRTHYGTKLDPALIQPICDQAYKYKMIDAPIEAQAFIWNGRA